MLRCFKLLRHDEVLLYFDKLDYQNRKSQKPGTFSMLQIFIVVYTFALAVHVIACGWLVPPRFEPDESRGWFAMDRFNIYAVDPLTKYVEAAFFVCSTMAGVGYGNVVPSTNPEWICDILVMIAGCSIYNGFFGQFAVAIYEQNKKQIMNSRAFDQAKQFMLQRQVPRRIKN